MDVDLTTYRSINKHSYSSIMAFIVHVANIVAWLLCHAIDTARAKLFFVLYCDSLLYNFFSFFLYRPRLPVAYHMVLSKAI